MHLTKFLMYILGLFWTKLNIVSLCLYIVVNIEIVNFLLITKSSPVKIIMSYII